MNTDFNLLQPEDSGYVPLPLDDDTARLSKSVGDTAQAALESTQSSSSSLKGRAWVVVDMFSAHQGRVAALHNTRTKKVAALLLTATKIALTITPLLVACPPAGFIALALIIIVPAILYGIKKGIEAYAAKQFPMPKDLSDTEAVKECEKKRAQFVQKHMYRIAVTGQVVGWIANPLGNLAGAILLKLGDVGQKKAEEKWGVDTRGAKAASAAFEILKFIGFHGARMMVPTLIDTPIQALSQHIQETEHADAAGQINGQNIRDQHFQEILWKSQHNIQHASGTSADAETSFLSQWTGMQSEDPIQAVQDPNVTAFQVDLKQDDDGNIIMCHGDLQVGDADYTREFFQTLANDVDKDNGRMVNMEIQNDGVPVDKLNEYFAGIKSVHEDGKEGSSLKDLFVASRDYDDIGRPLTMGEIYDKGDKIFVTTDLAKGETAPEWASQRGSWEAEETYRLLWTPQEMFDQAERAGAQTDQDPTQSTVLLGFGANVNNMEGTGSTQELINSRLGDFMKEFMAKHRHVEGGTVTTDYADQNTAELDQMIETWNETPPNEREALLDNWEKQGYDDLDHSLTQDALEIVARRMFLTSFFRLKDAAVNPLGDAGDFSSTLAPKKKER